MVTFLDLISRPFENAEGEDKFSAEFECDNGEKIYAAVMKSGSVGLGAKKCKNEKGEYVDCWVTWEGVHYKGKLCNKSNYVGFAGAFGW